MNNETSDRNELLMEAVSYFKLDEVKRLLKEGANPNYYRLIPGAEGDDPQPDTPLRMVMFRISDSFLKDEDLKKFGEIAKILLEYGADPKPAMEIAESRYGTYDPKIEDGPFMDVWNVVANSNLV